MENYSWFLKNSFRILDVIYCNVKSIMGTPTSVAESPSQSLKIIYWNTPVFNGDGSVNEQSLQKFLLTEVPNNSRKRNKNNEWDPGKEFKVQFRDKDNKEDVVYICVLKGKKAEDWGIRTICTRCERKSPLPLPKTWVRVEEILMSRS